MMSRRVNLSSLKDMNFWMREKEEVEIVDFLIQVKDCMVGYYSVVQYVDCTFTVSQLTASNSSQDYLLTSSSTSSPQANALRHYPSVPSHTLQALQGQIRTIVSKLPEDLQSCLKPSFMQWLRLIPIQSGNEAMPHQDPDYGSLTLTGYT